MRRTTIPPNSVTTSIGPANRSEPSSVADSIGTARAHDHNDPACHLEDNVFGALQTKDHALAHHWHAEFQNVVLDPKLLSSCLNCCKSRRTRRILRLISRRAFRRCLFSATSLALKLRLQPRSTRQTPRQYAAGICSTRPSSQNMTMPGASKIFAVRTE